MSTAALLSVGDEVARALGAGEPVVALESTIISHGLPRPRNLEVAFELEALARSEGAVPATVGVVDGRPTVGLSRTQIERLATRSHLAKASVRELPIVAALRRDAATTVAATAYLAHQAGIRVFATGGLGGVHRRAGETFDESADLSALSRTPITVVSAGVKSVLDVPATLERLETLGIPIVGFRSRRLAGFYVADGGWDLEWPVDSAAEVAELMMAADSLSIPSALLVSNPVPEAEQLDPILHEELLSAALEASQAAGVTGKAVTPFLLDHIYRGSKGASLEANLAAVRNNVRLAAAIAGAWAARQPPPTTG
jgi:pseudouridine-5'-phosphate glycosidase